MGKRKTEDQDQAAQGIRGIRRGEAAANRLLKRREGGGATAAQVGERGGGFHHQDHLHRTVPQRVPILGTGSL